MSPDGEDLKGRIKVGERRLSRKLGSQARILREAQQLSQTDMSVSSGLIRHAISRFEYGEATPTIGTLLRIAEGLGVELRIEFVSKPIMTKFVPKEPPTTQKEE